MQIAITCRHGNLSQGNQTYISQKAEKLVTYFDRVTSIEITVDFQNDHAKVEILVGAEHKHNFVAQGIGETVPASFDTALHRMEQQVRKYKEKIQDHRRTPPTNQVVQPESGAD